MASNGFLNKNRYLIFYLLLAIFCIFADIVIFAYFFDTKKIFWLSHFILTLVYMILIHDTEFDAMFIFKFFTFMFPVIGFLMLAIYKTMTFFLKPKLKGIESELVVDKTVEKLVERISYFKVYRTLFNYYDLIRLNYTKRKSDFLLFSSERLPIPKAVEIFKIALLDKDVDIVHYAGVKINKIKTTFLDRIKNAKDDKEELIKACYGYCESGIPKAGILSFYQKKIITEYEQLENKSEDVKLIYFKICIDKKQYEKCRGIADEILNDDPTKEILEKLQEGFYYQDDNEYYLKIEKILKDKKEMEKQGKKNG